MANARPRPHGRKTAPRGIGGVQEETVLDTPEALTMGERIAQVRDRFKMGPHHKMERFGIILGTTVVGLVLVTGLSYSNYHHDMTNVETATALLSTDFTFSKTNQTGTVEGVFGDATKKDVFVLFKLSDPKSMSTAAKNYQVFITGEKENLDPELVPTGSFALFGSTGYGFIRFEDKRGLENGTLRVTIRANAKLAAEAGAPTVEGDATDAKFDQATFFVNPGATKTTPVDVAVGEDDPRVLYRALVGQAADKKVRDNIQVSTDLMANLLNRAKEYDNRIRSAGYIPQPTPKFVQGDYVEDKVLHAETNVYNAHGLDYATKTLADGYVNQVLKDGETFDAYMAKWREKDISRDVPASEMLARPTVIKSVDGTSLNLDSVVENESPSAQLGVKTAATDLFDTYQSYLTEKRKIQRDYAYKLLVIDADVQSQEATYSEVTSTKKHIFFY